MDELVGLPEGVEDFLGRFVATIEATLDEELVAAYVHGSVAAGNFVPFRSDLDLMVVVARPLDLATKSTLLRRLWELESPEQVRGVETRVVTRDEISTPDRMSQTDLVVSTHPGEPLTRDGVSDDELLIELSVARKQALTLIGPPASELIGPVDRRTVLAWMRDRRLESISSHPEGYAVINACRSLVFEQAGQHLSKLDAAEWAIERGYPEDLLRHAMAVQTGTKRDRPITSEGRRFIEGVSSRLEDAIGPVSE